MTEFTVSDLAGAIKRALEEGFGYVRLRGEISGFRGPHASGHCYFGLKDDKAKIEAVVWKTTWARLKVKPEEGMEVVVQGRVTTYPGSSKYQIVIESLEPAGVGALMALIEERKRKFAAEGLFEEARKKARPYLPRLVGIITSPTGAVIRDMLHGFSERFPTRVIVWPVRVQGETCAAEVAAAIAGFNAFLPGGRFARPDVLIVARGGGSLEDLWGFNEEIVVRAVAASRIPVISAVGHETDWTLIDLVADARAPTPTKAAEWAVPKYAELAESTDKFGVPPAPRRPAARCNRRARTSKPPPAGCPRLEDMLALPRQRFDACEKRLARALLANTRAHHTRLCAHSLRGCGRAPFASTSQSAASAYARRKRAPARHCSTGSPRDATGSRARASCSPRSATRGVLQRGFVLVRDPTGHMVREAAAVRAGDALEFEFRDGRVDAETRSVRTTGVKDRGGPSLPPQPPSPIRRCAHAPSARQRPGCVQGSLFEVAS